MDQQTKKKERKNIIIVPHGSLILLNMCSKHLKSLVGVFLFYRKKKKLYEHDKIHKVACILNKKYKKFVDFKIKNFFENHLN